MLKLSRFFFLFIFLYTQQLFGFSVLLDPGHGGEDIGAIAKIKRGKKTKIIYEKDLTLTITKMVYDILRKKYSVYLTRSIDRTIPLLERASLAEKMKADLLVSIHFNSSANHAAQGMEIYYLDNHKDKAVSKVEQLENFSDKSQKEDAIQHILTDLVIGRTVVTSKKLSGYVHQELSKVSKSFQMKDRGVKPGLFYVLLLANRPGLLVEVGFLSNPTELRKMLTKKFQKAYANALAQGISRYIDREVGVPEILF